MLPYKELARLDKLVHEPARLAILTALSACTLAEFLFLQELTGLTKGNLSSHLAKLEKAELIVIDKHFIRKKIPQTTVRITDEGRAAVDRHWKQLASIHRAIQRQGAHNENHIVSRTTLT
ncbi:MAG: transcriptional regulator [Firmicutes bacterium]|uniref:DNA-binding transcriptional regulator, ArsR family n=1 Tax=Melghirimyces thermohalophilus TaxID=1236220 RepID=A0A1G6J996_9BACL|nr:transcriptional regulator [Melghirimyces thermohalophilus]MDA8353193.1 transcriptional regulator [Bacillota bacterium]SDC14496.1 DNA-binding transcriptional regulator, ArsR family [Melghirimyces thermohalophilus]